MAHFDRTRAPGLWTALSPLLHEEMEDIDAKLSKAINGDEGGTWAPATPIEIGGSGIKITGLAEFTGEFKVTTEAKLQGGALITGGDLTVSQNATVQGDLTVSTKAGFGGAPEAGFAAKVTGNCKITGTCTVSGDLAAASNVSVQGNVSGQGTATFTGNVTGDSGLFERIGIHGAVVSGEVFSATGKGSFTSDLAVGGALAVTGAASAASLSVSGNATLSGTTKAKGRFKRRVLTMSDADTSVSVSDYDMVYMPASVMSTSRNLTVSTSGAEDGDVLRVICEDSTYDLNVEYNSNSTLLKIASTQRRWLELTYISSAWRLSGYGDRE